MENTKLDVICQHRKDGSVIPIKIRIPDEDGAPHIYTIKCYKDVSGCGAYTTPDGMYVTNNISVFVCNITVLGMKREIRLYYNRMDSTWSMMM